MQHPPELKTKFLELRARGIPYSRIAEAIGVSKPTLIQWGKSMAEEIADLQAAEREFVHEKLLGNFEQWLGRQVHHFNRLDEEFGRREFKYSPTESVFRMMMASRKLLDRYFFDDDKPSGRGARTSSSVAAQGTQEPLLPRGEGQDEGQTGSSCSLRPSELSTQNSGLCADDRGDSRPASEPPTNSLNPQLRTLNFPPPAPPRPCVEIAPENPSKTQPFPHQSGGGSSSNPQNPTFYPPFIHQKEGGSTSAAPHNHNPAPSASPPPGVDTTELPNQQSDTDSGDNSVAGKFISALRRLQACAADSPSESTALCADSAGSQAEIRNPQCEIESAFATSHPGVESSAISARAEASRLEGPSSETQNPGKTLPFTSQNSGLHHSNLSKRDELVRSPDPSLNPNRNLNLASEGDAPRSQTAEDVGGLEPEIANSESGLENESIPFGPDESTREWLERQGIRVPRCADLPIVTKSDEGLVCPGARPTR